MSLRPLSVSPSLRLPVSPRFGRISSLRLAFSPSLRLRLRLLLCASALAAVPASAASPDPAKTRTLVATLQRPDAPVADRARALQQLSLVASPDAIPAVVPLLGDPQLGQYARDVLENLPDPAASAALRSALTTLRGPALIGAVNSLGLRRDPLAVAPLTALTTDAASPVAPPALLALGRIGTPEALRPVSQRLAAGPAALRPAAAEALLVAADRALASGSAASALPLFQTVRAAPGLPAPLHLAATRGVIFADSAGGLDLLLAQLAAPDADARDLALLTLRELRGPTVTRAVAAALDRFDPPLRALVLGALIDRADPDALAVAEARAAAGPDEVRLVALQGLGRLGRASSLPLLLASLRPATPATLVDAALAALARIQVPDTDAAVLAALPTAAPALQVRLMALLGERKASAAFPEFLRLARAADPVLAQAALRALALVAQPRDLPALVDLAVATTDDAAKTLADRAIVTTSMKILEPARRADAVLDAFRRESDPAVKAALLRPLGALVRSMGAPHELFFALRPALADPAPTVRAAAVALLADWPSSAPVTALLDVAAQPATPPDLRETALRGATRLAGAVAAGRERSPLDVVAAFTAAARLAATPTEKRLVAAGLGAVRRPEAVALLLPFLADADVRADARLALVQVAAALGAPKPGTPLHTALEQIAADETDDDLRRRAARLARGESAPAAAPKGKAKKNAPAPAPVTAAPAPATPVSGPALFNGTDLAGWDGDPGVWRVRDGVIVGGNPDGNPRNEFLATTRRHRNFVLRLDYRLVGTKGFVNGGVQFRSVRIAQPAHEMSGYQADIGAGHSGSLYDESRRKKFLARATDEQLKRLEKPGEWNRYEIRCEGPRVQLFLNGEKTVDYTETDPAVAAADGLIALQIHGNCAAEISFRNLTLDPLP